MSCLWLNPIALPFALILMTLYRVFRGAPDNESLFAYALALFFIAVIVRLVLLPFQMKGKRGMMRQTRLQPRIAELQKRHGANKQKLNEEMAKLYKEEGVNPASGCLWSFIQMPIMIALFYAIRQPISLMMRLESDLWVAGRGAFNKNGVIYNKFMELINQGVITVPENLLPDPSRVDPAVIDLNFFDPANFYVELYITNYINAYWDHFKNLGLSGLERISFYLGSINLADVPNYRLWEFDWSSGNWLPALILFMLPLISGGSQFLSAHINRNMNPQPVSPDGKQPGGMMLKLMPLVSVWFGFMLPAALSIYWTIGTFLQVGQDIWLTRRYTKILDEEDAEKENARKEKEAEIEAKRLETERLKAEGLLEENPNTSKKKKAKNERQSQREKAVQWERKNAPADEKETSDEPGRVGNRRYARGRAYDPDRYVNSGGGYDGAQEDRTGGDGASQGDVPGGPGEDNTIYEGEIVSNDSEDDDY